MSKFIDTHIEGDGTTIWTLNDQEVARLDSSLNFSTKGTVNGGSLSPVQTYQLHANDTGSGEHFRQVPVVQVHNFASSGAAQGVIKDYLAWGYTPVFFSQLYTALAAKDFSSLPVKPIVFTDDDGGASAYTALYPALQALGVKCTYFIVPDWIDGTISAPANGGSFMEASPITWAQAIEMQASGLVEFQSHTKTHGSLRLISGVGTFNSVEDGSGAGADFLYCKARIEAQVPGANVRFNACPYGVINETAIASLKAAGCLASRISETGLDIIGDYDGGGPGGYVYPWTDPLRVPIADNGSFKSIKQHNLFGVADADGNLVQNGDFTVTQRGWTLPSGWTQPSGVTLPTGASPASGSVLQGAGVAAATPAYHTDMIPVGTYAAYTLDWWVNCTNAPAASVVLQLDCFLDANDTVPVQTLTESSPIGGTTGWTSKRWYIFGDGTYAWVRPKLSIVGAGSSAQAQLWRLKLRRIRPAYAHPAPAPMSAVSERISRQGRAIKIEPFAPYETQGQSVATAGAMFGTLVGIPAGTQISKVACLVAANAAVSTLVKLGIWDSAGNLLAQTADLSAAFNSGSVTRVQEGALTGTWTAPATDVYYLGGVFVGGTGPTLRRHGSADGIQINGGPRSHLLVTGQSDIAAVTPANGTLAFYFAGY